MGAFAERRTEAAGELGHGAVVEAQLGAHGDVHAGLADDLLGPDFGGRAVADHVDRQAVGIDAHVPQAAADQLCVESNVLAVFRPQVEVEPGR